MVWIDLDEINNNWRIKEVYYGDNYTSKEKYYIYDDYKEYTDKLDSKYPNSRIPVIICDFYTQAGDKPTIEELAS